MIIRIVTHNERIPSQIYHTIELQQGVQCFTLDYVGTKKECQWYAKMFRKALKAHDKERLTKL